MLVVYVMNITIFNAGWFTFAPIADVVKCYYNVSTFWTNSLTLVTMVVYIGTSHCGHSPSARLVWKGKHSWRASTSKTIK